jgi:hypothetical protein
MCVAVSYHFVIPIPIKMSILEVPFSYIGDLAACSTDFTPSMGAVKDKDLYICFDKRGL